MLDGEDKYAVIQSVAKLCFSSEFHASRDKITGKSAVVVIGPTGAGKSTLINYLLGSRYRREGVEGSEESLVLQPHSLPETSVVSSSTVTSSTFTPQVYAVPSQAYVLCDFPGFADTRGYETAVASTLMCQAITHAAKGIQKIIFTLDAPTLMVSRGNVFSQYFSSLKTLLGGVEFAQLSSVVFALTKFPPDTEVVEFIKQFIQPKYDELKNREARLTEDEQVIYAVCHYILKHPEAIICANPCDQGNTASILFQSIHESEAIDPATINFLDHDLNTRAFLATLDEIIVEVNAKAQYESDCEIRNKDREEAIKSLDSSIRQKHVFLDTTRDYFLEKLQLLESEKNHFAGRVKSIEACIETESQAVARNEEALSFAKNELARLSSLSQPISVSLQRFNTGPDLNAMRLAMRGVAAALQRGNRIKVSHAFDNKHVFAFQSEGPICAVTLNGQPLPLAGIVNQNALHYVHVYPFAKGTQAVLEVFIRECDTAENVKKIQLLQENIPLMETALAESISILASIQTRFTEEEETLRKIEKALLETQLDQATFNERSQQIAAEQQDAQHHIEQLLSAVEEDCQQCRIYRRENQALAFIFPKLIELLTRVGLSSQSSSPSYALFIATAHAILEAKKTDFSDSNLFFTSPDVSQNRISHLSVISSLEATL